MKPLLLCFGTRPEYIKLKPLIKAMSGVIPYKLLFSGQHEDLIKVSVDYTLKIEKEKDRLASILSSCANADVLSQFEYILVMGDTATAAGIAISAFNRGKKVIHLEAGLRSNDLQNPFPEEAYRKIITTVSSINL